VERARERDPVITLGKALLDQGILKKKQIDEIAAEALRATDEATDLADASSQPDPAVLHDSVYSP